MTTLQLNRDHGVHPTPAKALIITPHQFQAHGLQQQLDSLGWPATIAPGPDAGRECLASAEYDLVVIDVDLGYPRVGALVEGLRALQPGTRVAMMLGWWDSRLLDMRLWSDLLIFKPTMLDQVRQVVKRVSAYAAPRDGAA
jgi:DNA-binding NtrC family response regulator